LPSYPHDLTKQLRSTAALASSPKILRNNSNRTSNSYSSTPIIVHGVLFNVSQKEGSGTANTRAKSRKFSPTV